MTRLLIVTSFLLFFALGLRAALVMAPTYDEPAHILRGYALRTSGDLQFQVGHAPFSHRLIGMLLASGQDAPVFAELSSWPDGERLQLASELLWQSGVDVDRFLFLARLPILWTGLILGALVGSWALTWHGRGATAVALTLFATSPNLLASASLATTDFVTAVTYFGAVYGWWRYYCCPKRRWWILTAVFLGLALATKLTAVLLLPVLFLLTLLFLPRANSFWRPFVSWLSLLPAALLVLWFVYGGQIERLPGWPAPIPAASYIVSWQSVLDHVARGHQAFFLGELSGDGWLSYFPVTFAIKTPLVTQILAVLGLIVIAARRTFWPTGIFLLLPVGMLFAAAMTSGLNIGYRHILPALPFVFVIAGSSVLLLQRWLATRLLLGLALLWLVFIAIRQQPFFLSYFNEIAGGSEEGYRYLGDSNLDWGQSLKFLAQKVRQEGGEWHISYAGAANPAYYGLHPDQLINTAPEELSFAPANPQPGHYAISANHWQGILPDADTFDWFRRRTFDETISGAMLIYDVTSQADGAWIAHCAEPAPLLEPSQAEALVGRSGLRHVYFDCTQSWVLPSGEGPGWYITPQMASWWPESLSSAESSARLSLVYRHRATAIAPSYDVYYWQGGALLPGEGKTGHTAITDGGDTRPLPAAPNENLTLDGYGMIGDDWVTFWRVNTGSDLPLSLQAHLYGEGDSPLQVGDRLGYSAEQWRPGDILWQRFHFAAQPDARFLETGLYDYLTLEAVGEALRLAVLP